MWTSLRRSRTGNRGLVRLLPVVVGIAVLFTLVALATQPAGARTIYSYDSGHKFAQERPDAGLLIRAGRRSASVSLFTIHGARSGVAAFVVGAEDVGPVSGKPIYRGVSRFTGSGEPNPAYQDALQGNAYPRNPDGLTSAAAHNYGAPEDLADSPFTSWTHRLDVAQLHAGDDGVILQWQTGAPPPGAAWKFEGSPDVWMEQEVLIRGPIEGAQVLP